MILHFSKYHGTGNDFIMIDNSSSVIDRSKDITSLIARLCHRRFGIGADGLILINKSSDHDFEMVYYNADGKEGSMCGNGGRCAVAFSYNLGLIKEKTIFQASDGVHEAIITNNENEIAHVELKMQDVNGIIMTDGNFLLNTGSPHFIRFIKNVKELDVYNEGRNIRYSNAFKDQGINVNFAEVIDDKIFVRTYERGVEGETLSCGTGVTATALAACFSGLCPTNGYFKLQTKGGELTVSFNKVNETSFNEIWLKGPVTCIYNGEINI